ncbi:DUF6302 family protein [Streptomyces sp. NPDC002073]
MYICIPPALDKRYGPPITAAQPHTAVDYAHYWRRLVDPSVLRISVAVGCRLRLLAVAVGGPRRGGYHAVQDRSLVLGIRDVLADRAGFPDVRLRRSPYADSTVLVEWGDPAPNGADPETLNAFYGYHSSFAADRFAGESR